MAKPYSGNAEIKKTLPEHSERVFIEITEIISGRS
jgi:hypothetical protein